MKAYKTPAGMLTIANGEAQLEYNDETFDRLKQHAKNRQRLKEKRGVKTRKHSPAKDVEIHLLGLMAKKAFATLVGLPFVAKHHESGDVGWDFVLDDKKVRVRGRTLPQYELYHDNSKQELLWDIAVLVTVSATDHTVTFRGWTTKEFFLAHARVTDFGNGTRLVIETVKLTTIIDLMPKKFPWEPVAEADAKKKPEKKPITISPVGDVPVPYLFVSPSIKAVHFGLDRNGIHRTEGFIAYLEGTGVGKKALEACQPVLDDMIRKAQPKVIIGAGAPALKLLKIKGTVRMRGTVGRYSVDGKAYKVIPTHSPIQLNIEPSLVPEYLEDVCKAKSYASGVLDTFDKKKLAGLKLTTVTTIAELDAALETIYNQPVISLDTETRGLSPWDIGPEATVKPDYLTMIQIAWSASEAVAIPIHHPEGSLPLKTVKERLWRFLWDYKGKIVTHNGKFDAKAVFTFVNTHFKIAFDTMIANSLITGAYGSNALKQMTYAYKLGLGGYDEEKAALEEDETIGHDSANFPLDALARYGMLDAICTWRIAKEQREALRGKPKRNELSRMLAKLSNILGKVEMGGIRIDWEFLGKYEIKLNADREHIETEIRELAGVALPLTEKDLTKEKAKTPTAFNFASTRHIGHLLYERMGIKCPLLTKGGATSVAKGALNAIDHPIAKKFLELSAVNQNLKMYVHAYPKVRHGDRIHPNYFIVKSSGGGGDDRGTVSGRTSVSDPNIQQLPRDDKGEVRSLILPDDDESLLVDCDFQTIEYRVAAMYCQDPTMKKFFNGPASDYHLFVASEVFEKPPEEITKEQRSLAKNVNFALLYGAGVTKISGMTGMPEEQVRGYIQRYFDRFPELDKWRRSVSKTVEEKHYVVSMLGRKRYLREAKSTKPEERSYAFRTGLNHLCQSTAADICFGAICKVDRLLKKEKSKARMLMTIHDSVVFSVPLTEINIIEKIRTTMEDCDFPPVKEAGVRIGVDAKAGVDYGNLLPLAEALEILSVSEE